MDISWVEYLPRCTVSQLPMVNPVCDSCGHLFDREIVCTLLAHGVSHCPLGNGKLSDVIDLPDLQLVERKRQHEGAKGSRSARLLWSSEKEKTGPIGLGHGVGTIDATTLYTTTPLVDRSMSGRTVIRSSSPTTVQLVSSSSNSGHDSNLNSPASTLGGTPGVSEKRPRQPGPLGGKRSGSGSGKRRKYDGGCVGDGSLGTYCKSGSQNSNGALGGDPRADGELDSFYDEDGVALTFVSFPTASDASAANDDVVMRRSKPKAFFLGDHTNSDSNSNSDNNNNNNNNNNNSNDDDDDGVDDDGCGDGDDDDDGTRVDTDTENQMSDLGDYQPGQDIHQDLTSGGGDMEEEEEEEEGEGEEMDTGKRRKISRKSTRRRATKGKQ
jgi:hypothetical protein